MYYSRILIGPTGSVQGFFGRFVSGFKLLFGPSGSLGVCPARTAQRVACGRHLRECGDNRVSEMMFVMSHHRDFRIRVKPQNRPNK
jgi:hypothetical protein